LEVKYIKQEVIMSAGSASGNMSKNKSSAYSKNELSSLAKTQEEILKERNQDYLEYYLPEFKDFYSSLDPDSEAGQAQMGLNANQVNASFDAAQKQTDQAMARQNITGSGAHLATIAANNRARSSALASAYANQMAASTQNKGNALAQLGQLVPSPTTAAPVLDNSSSKGYANAVSGMII
jgi:hypothetical protein